MDLHPLESVEARPPAHAASEPDPARSLRRELQDCIANREAAQRTAAAAKQVSARAEEAKVEAALLVEQLKAGMDGAQRAAIREHVMRLTQAFRRGEPLPPAPTPPEADSAALTGALSRLSALHASACELAAEAAAQQVDSIAGQILDLETRQLVSEMIAVQEMSWRLEDRLKAIFGLDAKRQRPRLLDLKKELNMHGERRNREQAKNKDLVETWKWYAFLEAAMKREAVRWLDYGHRLAVDAAAVFDEGETEQ